MRLLQCGVCMYDILCIYIYDDEDDYDDDEIYYDRIYKSLLYFDFLKTTFNITSDEKIYNIAYKVVYRMRRMFPQMKAYSKAI